MQTGGLCEKTVEGGGNEGTRRRKRKNSTSERTIYRFLRRRRLLVEVGGILTLAGKFHLLACLQVSSVPIPWSTLVTCGY